jgi:hypothetical protein
MAMFGFIVMRPGRTGEDPIFQSQPRSTELPKSTNSMAPSQAMVRYVLYRPSVIHIQFYEMIHPPLKQASTNGGSLM